MIYFTILTYFPNKKLVNFTLVLSVRFQADICPSPKNIPYPRMSLGPLLTEVFSKIIQ